VPPTNASFCLSVKWDISAQSDVLCELLNSVKLRIAHPKNASFRMRGRCALSSRSDVLGAELCKGKGARSAPGVKNSLNYVLLNLPPFVGSDQSQEKPFVSATN
jgi:hypothetical protein